MKKYSTPILLILLLSFTLLAQTPTNEQSKQTIISGDNPAEVIVFTESLKDEVIQTPNETDDAYKVRLKSFLLETKYQNKPLSEVVFIVQEGLNYDKGVGEITSDFYNRKIADSDYVLNVVSPAYEKLSKGLEVAVLKVNPETVNSIKQNLRLAVYGFPIRFDKRFKSIDFIPLKYVFFNGSSGEIYAVVPAVNKFSKYFSGNPKSEPATSVVSPSNQKSVTSRRIEFIGDSESKNYYSFNCVESTKINDSTKVLFSGKEEAETKGFKSGSQCTPFPKPPKTDSLKPLNLLQIDTYAENYYGKLVSVVASIRNISQYESCIDADMFRFDIFEIIDESVGHKKFFLLIRNEELRNTVRYAIVKNNGDSVDGKFTFALSRNLSSKNCYIGVVSSFTLY